MICRVSKICGGCVFRDREPLDYEKLKEENFLKVMEGLNQPSVDFGNPVFIPDGMRRRVSFAFSHTKGKLALGFNEARSSQLVDVSECALLTQKINKNIQNIRELLLEICRVKISHKKGKKTNYTNVYKGNVYITEAFNGLDVVLEFDDKLELEHRMIVSEMSQSFDDVLRISHRKLANSTAETVIEKTKPFIKIADYDVYIAAGSFLQASDMAEKALIDLVVKYLGNSSGKIADLFCGIGTFSYPLSRDPKNQVLAIDSSDDLLSGFKQSINKNMISNISIKAKNLFKYPLDEAELKGFDVVVFDPPRAGALEQVRKISKMKNEDKPHKIIAISCNPNSFVRDANVLTETGYFIKEITLVDQFIYSNHSELVALFELV